MREKQGYRDMLSLLMERYPNTLTRTQAAECLGISRQYLGEIIQKGHIKIQDSKIPIGSIASYLCG